MILNLSTKSITLFLAIGVASTTSAADVESTTTTNFLRQNKNREKKTSTVSKSYLRSPLASSATTTTASGSTERRLESSLGDEVDDEPYIDLSSDLYLESTPITVSFSIGAPTHSYYSSSYAPSLNLNTDYPQWSIGLYMRDADPQGGTLSPIVSINVCSASFDDVETTSQCDVNYESYNNLSVTFSNENRDIMEGVWPLEVSAYGTGYDAYVLDANGAAAIGPYEFYITNDEDSDLNTVDTHHDRTSSGMKKSMKSTAKSSSVSSTTLDETNTLKKSGLMKYNKGTKTSSRHHATVVGQPTNNASKVNNQMANSNGLEMSSNAYPESTYIHKTVSSSSSSIPETKEDKVVGPSKNYITPNKEKYEHDGSISINFAIVNNNSNNSEENVMNKEVVDLSKYKIGLYMRMAHPEGLDPIVSLPLCSAYSSTTSDPDSDSPHSETEESNCVTSSFDGSPDRVTFGSVTFSSETISPSSSWPLDLYQWGTGYDAYIINENGLAVVGPVKFDLMMDDTY